MISWKNTKTFINSILCKLQELISNSQGAPKNFLGLPEWVRKSQKVFRSWFEVFDYNSDESVFVWVCCVSSNPVRTLLHWCRICRETPLKVLYIETPLKVLYIYGDTLLKHSCIDSSLQFHCSTWTKYNCPSQHNCMDTRRYGHNCMDSMSPIQPKMWTSASPQWKCHRRWRQSKVTVRNQEKLSTQDISVFIYRSLHKTTLRFVEIWVTSYICFYF